MNERIRGLLNEATFGLETDLSKQRTVTLNEIEKFAALVAAAEREACAKVCESLEIPHPDTIEGLHPDYVDGKRMAVMQCAAAIRARGNE